jgi:hypothetical protein
MRHTITRRTSDRNDRRQLGEGLYRDKTGTDRQRGTRHAIRHPNGNRGGVLVVIAQPELATRANRASHLQGLAVQRMPAIVNGDLLSVVGGM